MRPPAAAPDGPEPGPPPPPLRLSWTVWGLGAFFYLVAFFHRLAPAVLTREWMADFGIHAAGLGQLSALYFYSYWLMQIPTGILADRWGPRRLLTAGAIGCTAGALVCGLAPNAFWAGAGRLLIGATVSVSFVVTLKLAAHWFPPRTFSMISGIALVAGITGALLAGVPLRLLVDAIGWRPAILASAAASAALALLLWVVVRDDPSERGFASYAPAVRGGAAGRPRALDELAEVLRIRNILLLVFIPAGPVGCVLTFCGLWGVPFLTQACGLSAPQAAGLTTLLLVAWALATPLTGRLTDTLGRRKPLMLAGLAAAIACWAVLLYAAPGLPPAALPFQAALTGIASSSFTVCWPLAKESAPLRLTGTVTGVINMGIMLGPTALQPAVGWMLDRFWDGSLSGGLRVYDAAAWRAAWLLPLGWLALSFGLLLFARETGGRQAA